MTAADDGFATYSLDEAAAYLGCSRWTLRDRVTRGEVPHRRTGPVKGVYFTDDDIRQIRAMNARPIRHIPSRTASRPRSDEMPAAPVTIPEEYARLKRAR